MRLKKKNYHFNYDIILDLHGKTLEDAISATEKVIYSGRYSNVMLIHGHGKGILKNGLRNFLKNCKYVKETIPGEDMNIPGGSGITIIQISLN